MRVVFYDILTQLPMGNNEPVGSLDDLLERSDFVTLHVPATAQTHLMIKEQQLARMKKGACLLNLSRGTVVDIPALAEAIKSGHVAGAAVDVYPEEPHKNVSDEFHSELQGVPNVVLTPHIGGSTLEAQENIGREVSLSLTKYLRDGATTSSVNFPSCELPFSEATHRVINIHQNVPGVLRDLNRIVSEADANVQAQLLSTNPEIGYLIMDLDRPVSAEVCERMAHLETTIRARALW
jgi:D-3-phosphoglycerate dehydrogenase